MVPVAFGLALFGLIAWAANSAKAHARQPSREELQEAASIAEQNGDVDLATELHERAIEAPSEIASEAEVFGPEEMDPDEEFSQMDPEQQEAVEALRTATEPEDLPELRQASRELEAQGAIATAQELEDQIEDIVRRADEIAPEERPEPPVDAPPLGPDIDDSEPDIAPPDESGPVSAVQDSAGYNPQIAAENALGLAANIRDRRYSYNRSALRGFQRAAGITIDGVYGPQSHGALQYYLGERGTAPKALFDPRGVGTVPYTPPA